MFERKEQDMAAHSIKAEFEGHSGATLAARLDMPGGEIRAWALFAHCFTCSKDTLAAKRISGELARAGIAVMRFDFTGLGSSDGEFASTNFSSNIQDLRAAADWLAEHHDAPKVLVGHSLGGAAVLAIAGKLSSVKAVVTIGAPRPRQVHVIRNFSDHVDEIKAKGRGRGQPGWPPLHHPAPVCRGCERHQPGRVHRQHEEGAAGAACTGATRWWASTMPAQSSPLPKHPKSFVSLDDADHLLTSEADANYVASVIAVLGRRAICPPRPPRHENEPVEDVMIAETGQGMFQVAVHAGPHRFLADEPADVGGSDTGPSPYDLMSAALGACTAMTLRMYARHKKIDLGLVTVMVRHNKMHAKDCLDCTDEERSGSGKIDRFERVITIDGGAPENLRDKIAEIAGKCPVHRTLEHASKVVTTVE